ncbi:rhodanese-like domain-containing protein [Candidatus Micrarchaeota archaeon]|nr:rhodanese-like domain-containing protein [Candidatus Micrarchaeota archaeon]
MNVTAREFLGNKQRFFVLDVRTPSETALYSLDGSHLLPLNELFVRLSELPKDKEILVVCRSGNRSGFAAGLLKEKGYRAFNLDGGLRDLVFELFELRELSEAEADRILLKIG